VLFSRWPIRNKLQLGLGLLAASILTLFGSAYYGLYAYRGLVKSLSVRSAELPLADQLRDYLAEFHEILSQVEDRQKRLDEIDSGGTLTNASASDQAVWDADGILRQKCRTQFDLFCQTLDKYRALLDSNRLRTDLDIGDDTRERETLTKIDDLKDKIRHEAEDPSGWRLDNEAKVHDLRTDVEKLHERTAELPSHLHERFRKLASEVHNEYRWAICLAWGTAVTTTILLIWAVQLFRKWIARPLATLVRGSREVAAGKFDHRIHLNTEDEMRELADAMNAMTTRFQEVREDLDCQVRERTKQVVRSEQLASVGFLAAGVAHEINNPLASIAMCSESLLESRLPELWSQMGDAYESERNVVQNYLEMIHKEAFRCKQITEKLLDFSRMGDPERHNTDLCELVSGVIEMVRHMGRYQNKNITLRQNGPVIAEICPQEMKQVVLNLITNGLDSIDAGGTVTVTVAQSGKDARLVVEDNGCGMTDEVLKHLFEPFFTRRRGGQGTGLGLSISYRIVEEHDGQITAQSAGPNKGSKFTVTVPLRQTTARPRPCEAVAA
jgi:two-component system, NtrC family, sensor kinase